MQYTKEAMELIKEIASDKIILRIDKKSMEPPQTEQIQFVINGHLANIEQREQLEKRLKAQDVIKNWAVLVEYMRVPQNGGIKETIYADRESVTPYPMESKIQNQ